MSFRDRTAAGRELAARLVGLGLRDPVVLALPRGGVPVAAEVGDRFGVPIEVFVARKVGMPGHEEFGIGAIAEGSDELVVTAAAGEMGIGAERLAELARRERVELDRRVAAYRGDRPLPGVAGRDVVLVDDGLATGVTAEAALRVLRAGKPRRLVLAVPVGAPDSARRMTQFADDVVCLRTPRDFFAVGFWYDDFAAVSDDEVASLLSDKEARR